MFLTVVVGFVMGVVGVMGADNVNEPPKCCFDNRFTATLAEVGGQVYPITGNVVFLDGTVQVARDFNRQREGTATSLRQNDGSYKTTYALKDYNSRLTYTQEEVDGTCVLTRMGDEENMPPPCIPTNATFVGSSVLGFGAKSLHINTWEYTVHMPSGADVLIKQAVTRDQCAPFAEIINGNFDGVSTALSYIFTAYHPGIEDSSVLDTPSDCPPPPFVVGRK